MIRRELITQLLLLVFLTPQFLRSQTLVNRDRGTSPVRRILILNEVHAYYPSVALIDEAIRESIQGSKYRIEIYREYMDSNLFPDKADQTLVRDLIAQKYRNRRPDIIVTVGSTAFHFMVEEHQKLFAGVPVFFCLPGAGSEFNLGPDFTGVTMGVDGAGTVDAALRLLPQTRHIIVVAGNAPLDREQLEEVKKQFELYPNKLDVSYITNLPMSDILERLRRIPPESVVLYTSVSRDSVGMYFTSQQAAPLITAASPAPVFALYDVYLNHGEVGGDFSILRAQGTIAGTTALKILDGAKPGDIPVAKAPNRFVFDWRALKRWGLDEHKLPPGSTVLYRQPTPWELYRWYFISGISLLILEALLISGLVTQRIRRRKTEQDLAMSNQRLRLALEVSKSVGWDWNQVTGQNRWFGDLPTIFGIQSDNHETTVGDFMNYVHPEDRKLVGSAVAYARDEHKPYTAEFRIVRKDGAIRWIAGRGKFEYSPQGTPVRMIGMAMDISERKRAEDAIASLSGRLIAAQEKERRRIAGEIHDDYQQRLAVVANDLEGLREEIGNHNGDTTERIRQLWNEVSELASDMHSLSHRLHSSTLEHLGLSAGVRAFCEEFKAQQGLDIGFSSTNVPRHVPPDSALCLFRVAQEALRNIKRHSGADAADVKLEWTGDRLHLVVSDSGKGFDPTLRSADSGIGIQSMEERLRLIGGSLDLQSQPSHGTTIHAWVPLRAASQSAE